MRPRALLLTLALSAGVLTGCGDDPGIEPATEARFDRQLVTWAHLRTLHYGDQEFTLPRRIRGLAVSDHGFFVELSDDGGLDGPTTWGFYDGETWLRLGGDPVGDVRVSADGERAGWVDADGPLRPAGRIREIVVADVSRGEPVLRDHSGMGGGVGDDLGDRYEELAPVFLGFDEDGTHAYWTDASGHGVRKRGDLSSGEVEVAEEPAGEGEAMNRPLGTVVDAYRGTRALPAEEGGPDYLQYGLLSPDGRFAVDNSAPGTTLVYDAVGRRRLDVDFPQRAQYFGGWLPGGRLYVVSTARRVESYSLTGPDPTRGSVVVCTLPAGSCEGGAAVPGLRDLVVPGADALLG